MRQHPDPSNPAMASGSGPALAPSPAGTSPTTPATGYAGPERRYRRDDERFRTLLDKISDTVTVVSPRGRILYSTGDHLGTTLHLGFGDRFEPVPLAALHPDDLEHVAAAWTEVVDQPGREVHAEVRIRRESGTWAVISATAVNLVDDPAVGGVVITTRDVTALRQAERLAVSQATVLELIARGADLDAVLAACVELVASNGSGDHPAIYLDDGTGAVDLRAGRQPADPARTWSQPILRLGTEIPLGFLAIGHEDPLPPHDHRARVTDVACSLVAIAVDRLDNEARLTHLATHDPLTGLPNRTLLLDRLDRALARQTGDEHDRGAVAVLFCDLDDFKVVNDSLGHDVGDQLLAAFAARLRSTVDPRQTVARFGGDEFVVLLEHTSDEDPAAVAEAIRLALREPFVLGNGQEFVVSASIGLTTGSSRRAADWLRDADAAMYQAKGQGRNRTVVFDTAMRQEALDRLEIQRDLRRAVRRGEITLHYQPVVELATGQISGLEALARWQHPERGLLGPHQFIPVAEQHGMIEELGHHIVDLALGDARILAEASGRDDLQMAVNVSAHQLDDAHLDRLVEDLCRHHRWDPAHLVLEITESALTREVDRPARLLDRLQDLGVRLSIDDFGTGYSSLARLGRLLVDQVKLDRSFVAAIDDPANRLVRLIDAVVAIGDRLGIEVVGEGVETASQLDHLRAIGCTHAQGFLFARPAPRDEIVALLSNRPTW